MVLKVDLPKNLAVLLRILHYTTSSSVLLMVTAEAREILGHRKPEESEKSTE